ncbi:hypothetical protein FBQ82_12085 [Anaerolineae bacterium CFX7]|nr:hypothetical protein [Anaerolineae bacterium CFX7]
MVKNILRKFVLVVIVCFLSGTVIACSSLPDEAKQSLEGWRDTGASSADTYKILTSQKATNLQYWLYNVNQFSKFQEVWCVVTDETLSPKGGGPAGRHFLLGRTGLLWEVILDFPDESEDGKKFFLGLGCNNW